MKTLRRKHKYRYCVILFSGVGVPYLVTVIPRNPVGCGVEVNATCFSMEGGM